MAGEWFSIQNKEWKYVYYMNGGEEEFYDFRETGSEGKNLACDNSFNDQKNFMRKKLIEWLEDLQNNSDPGAPVYLENGDLKKNPYNPNIFEFIKKRSLAHRIPEYLL